MSRISFVFHHPPKAAAERGFHHFCLGRLRTNIVFFSALPIISATTIAEKTPSVFVYFLSYLSRLRKSRWHRWGNTRVGLVPFPSFLYRLPKSVSCWCLSSSILHWPPQSAYGLVPVLVLVFIICAPNEHLKAVVKLCIKSALFRALEYLKELIVLICNYIDTTEQILKVWHASTIPKCYKQVFRIFNIFLMLNNIFKFNTRVQIESLTLLLERH